MIRPIHLKEALRMYKRATAITKNGFRQYNGTDEEICTQIIDECYEKKYFRVSTGHFCEFYVRDFAFCCEALITLGYSEQVRSTLQYALSIFKKNNRITTSISPDGIPFDFPAYAPDSLALFLLTLTRTKNDDLVRKDNNGAFLQSQINIFIEQVIDKTTVLPKKRRFSGIRDHAKRKGSCYDMVMIAVVARESRLLGFDFPYTLEDITRTLLSTYWNGTYFFEDLQRQNIVVGDANVFPFWTGIIDDKEMMTDAFIAMQAARLDAPFPLRYVNSLDKKREGISLHLANMFAGDYETDSMWIHMGLCYMQLLTQINPALAKQHLAAYTRNIEKHKNFLEVYSNSAEPFRTAFYTCDEGMLWCANYLVLKNNMKNVN